MPDDTEQQDAEQHRQPLKIKIPSRSDKRLEVETDAGKHEGRIPLVVKSTVEHGNGPEHLQRSVAKPNEFHIVAGSSLVPEPGMLSSSNLNPACSAGADERAPKRARSKKKKSARKQRPSVLDAPRTTDPPQTLDKMTDCGIIAELDHDMDHTAAKVYESHVDGGLPPHAFTFDEAGEKAREEKGFPHDSTLSEYPVHSSFVSEKEPHASRLSRPKLPVIPPIWAQVRRIIYEEDSCYMAPSLDRKCASPSTTSGAIKVASIKLMT